MQPKLNNLDALLLIIITILSFATRFWNIQWPNCVVFDEIHFGNFTNWYTKSEFFYDIHPPLGKLIMFLFANLSEYDGNINFEKNYGKPYDDDQYVILRLTPAFFSSLCAPLIYLTVRFSNFSRIAAFVASFFIVFDTSLLCEQRFILSDGMLHFFTCLFLAFWSYLNSFCPFKTRWEVWMVCTGVTLGCACSCKNTSWGLMVFIAFSQIIQVFSYRKKLDLDAVSDITYRGVLLFVSMFSVYLISFVVHFVILPFDGQGTAYLTSDMQKQLISKKSGNGQLWAKRLTFPNLYFRIITLAVNMHIGNMGITGFHPYQSRPQGWPLLTDAWVAFWGDGKHEVNCIGNVFIYYIVFFSLFAVSLAFKSDKYKWAIPFVFGWCVSYFPFFLIPRSMYLYHYLIPLILGCCCAGIMLDLWLPKFWKGFVAVIMCVLALIGFYFWSPYAYGSKRLSNDIILWTSNWQFGDKYHRELQRKNRN